MFEQPAIKSEKDRSKTIMMVSGLAVLVVIVLIIAVTSFGRRQSVAEFAHTGSPEFDAYVPNVTIGEHRKEDRRETEHQIRQNSVCTVQNAGDQVNGWASAQSGDHRNRWPGVKGKDYNASS